MSDGALLVFARCVGFVFRAMISYAGTITVGKAAQLYYECGETMTRSQAQRLYREAYAGSKERIRALANRIRPGRGGGRRALKAAPPVEDSNLDEPVGSVSTREGETPSEP